MQSKSELPGNADRKCTKMTSKSPNILILCENKSNRVEISGILKNLVARDRYAIYDIYWDQLSAGGWAETTALLVLAGKIPDDVEVSILLQFLDNGGKLFGWCCESPPFGPQSLLTDSFYGRVEYGAGQQVTTSLPISKHVWGDSLEDFKQALKTSGLELSTFSVYGRVHPTNQICIAGISKGHQAGKAILCQVEFETCAEEKDAMDLLVVMLSQDLGIECLPPQQPKVPDYTGAYLLGNQQLVEHFVATFPTISKQDHLTLELVRRGEKNNLPASEHHLPIFVGESAPHFSQEEYFEQLTTKKLGRLVLHTDVITSTMDVTKGQFLDPCLVVIAARQTTGRGRCGNVWLSPEGCAMFSFQLLFDTSSQLSSHLTLIQHCAALSIVRSVATHKELGLCVKWPNDVYVNQEDVQAKIGGIRVESTIIGWNIIVNIGIGFNVCNEHPTVSLKSLLEARNKGYQPDVTVEKAIARIISELEVLINMLENGEVDKVVELYIENWMHGKGEESVKVEVTQGQYETCRILGIDKFGFLRVKEVCSDKEFSVRPDGNSFDLRNKLIAMKK